MAKVALESLLMSRPSLFYSHLDGVSGYMLDLLNLWPLDKFSWHMHNGQVVDVEEAEGRDNWKGI